MNKITKNSVFLDNQFLIKLFILLLFCSSSYGQVQNNDLIFVSDSELFHIDSGSYTFGSSPAQSLTTRNNLHGVFSFGANLNYQGQSNNHFIDGYVRTTGILQFIFPIGQSGIYAPAKIIPSNTNDIEAAYFRTNPTTIGTNLDNSVSAISNLEYWDIKSTSLSTTISLSWRASSNIGNLTDFDLANLTIIGWDGSKWIQLPSTVDQISFLGAASDLNSGTITVDFPIQLSSYSAFSLGSKKGACAPLIASSVNLIITWNGAWSPSVPTLRDIVQINSPYQAGSFSCNTLELNADVSLLDGEFIDVNGSVTGPNKIIMSSESSFKQRNNNVTAPKIELTKRTRPMRRNDYVYWGTPISGNFISQIDDAIAGTGGLTNAFDLKYKYNSGSTGGWVPLDAISTGKGFITRVKNQAPFQSDNYQDTIDLKFNGVANNGDISVSVFNSSSSPEGPNSHNLLANPYPSPIDAELFLRDNLDIDGAIYLWSSATQNSGGSYVQNDYAVWNLAGTINTSPIPQNIDGRIASGQGFKVKALTNGNVTFTNCMRLTTGNNNFFKNSYISSNISVQKDRYKLNMTNDKDVFSQILIAYLPESTLGYDRLYDAGRNSASTAQLYSVFEGDGRALAINSRSLFNVSDVVPLGISKNNTKNENFTINITEREGIFSTDDVTVYLYDKLLGVYHDLALGAYSFKSKSSVSNDRFQIVYQKNTPTDGIDNQFFVTIKENQLEASSQLEMNKIEVFDLLGKKIHSYTLDSKKIFDAPFNHPNAVYIVKIQFASGEVANQKLINHTN